MPPDDTKPPVPMSPVVTSDNPSPAPGATPPEPMLGPSSPMTTMPPVISSPGKKSKKKLFIGLAVVLVVIALAVGYVFAYYLPNTPDGVYSASLSNTAKGLDDLIAYSKTQEQVKYKSTSFEGTVNVKSPSASFDLTSSGAFDEKNGSAQMAADILGQKVNANLRVVTASGNTTPDVYLQVSGIKPFLSSLGADSLSSLDGQWIAVDHTLIDTYEASLKSQLGQTSPNAQMISPTSVQVYDAISKVQSVNRQYIFTTDKTKAVLLNQKFIAEESQNGRTMDHYTMGYNRDNLLAYSQALAAALDASQLNDWSKQVNSGKNLSEVMNFTDLESSIKSAKADYTFDLWADKSTKIVSKIAFADPSDSSSVFTISQGYTGGTSFPFELGLTSKDANGNPQTGKIDLTVDGATNKVTAAITADLKDNTGETTVDGNFTLTPSNNSVTVTAPAGAKSIVDILQELGLGGLTSGNMSPLSTLST